MIRWRQSYLKNMKNILSLTLSFTCRANKKCVKLMAIHKQLFYLLLIYVIFRLKYENEMERLTNDMSIHCLKYEKKKNYCCVPALLIIRIMEIFVRPWKWGGVKRVRSHPLCNRGALCWRLRVTKCKRFYQIGHILITYFE